jgi:hypothetical protein
MKILYTTTIFLCLALRLLAQDSTSENGDDFYKTYEELPLNAFLRLSTNIFTVNAVPADIDFHIIDDDFLFPDTLRSTYSTDKLWTYGFSLEYARLFGDNYVWSYNNHFGWGDNLYFFTYITQLGVGKDFPLGKLYAQPMFSIGHISSSSWMDEFNDFDNGFFELNGRTVISDLVLKLKSRTFSLSPSLSLDYPINDYLSIYAKGSAFYTFGRRSFVRVTGTTDEIDDEGNNISTFERLNFTDRRLEVSVNDQILNDAKTPYLHFNLNSVLIQLGVTLSFSTVNPYE